MGQMNHWLLHSRSVFYSQNLWVIHFQPIFYIWELHEKYWQQFGLVSEEQIFKAIHFHLETNAV